MSNRYLLALSVISATLYELNKPRMVDMTETPLTEAECAFKQEIRDELASYGALSGPGDGHDILEDIWQIIARRQLGDPLQVWIAAIEAAAERMELNECDEDEHIDDPFELIAEVRALQPPSSWAVSPLVEEVRLLRECLDEFVNYSGFAASPTDDQYVMDRARAALANHEPREGGEL